MSEQKIPPELREELGTIRLEILTESPAMLRTFADFIDNMIATSGPVHTEVQYGHNLLIYRVKSEDEAIDEAGEREGIRRLTERAIARNGVGQ